MRINFCSTLRSQSFWQYAFLLFLFTQCKKDERLPAPEGKSLPYQQPVYDSLTKVLAGSSYTLFNAACARLHFLDSLQSLGGSGLYTVFVPTDAAMQASGYTAAWIAAADPAVLDTLLAYHTLRGNFSDSALAGLRGSMEASSPLANIPIQLADGSTISYSYSLYLEKNQGLKINGRQVNHGQACIPAANGFLYPLDSVIRRPMLYEDMYAVLKKDTARFGFYIAACQISDSIYKTNIFTVIGQDSQKLALNAGYYQGYQFGTYQNSNYTLLAPTNQAFETAGFHSVADIRAFCLGNPVILLNSSYNLMSPMDTLITRHLLLAGVFFYDDLLLAASGGIASKNRFGLSFYGKLNYGNYNTPETLYYTLAGTGIQVGEVDSLAAPANISPEDIFALNGVIHPVDRLFR